MTQTQDPKRKIAHGPTIHAIKRAKYEAKQRRRLQQQTESSCALSPPYQQTMAKWFHGKEEWAAFVTAEDVHAIRRRRREAGEQRRDNLQSPVVDRIQRDTSGDHHNVDNSSSQKVTCVEIESEMSRLERIAAWIDPFFDLKEMPHANAIRRTGENSDQSCNDRLFIAEGTEAVRLMIEKCLKTSKDATEIKDATDHRYAQEEHRNAPPVRILSILCKPATFFERPVCLADELVKRNCLRLPSHKDNNPSVSPCPFKIIVGSEEALSEIVGFPLARGAMACGIVPRIQRPLQWLKYLSNRDDGAGESETNDDDETIAERSAAEHHVPKPTPKPVRILALDAVSNASNLGSILRTAAAFGVDAVLLSEDSCDAWYRQAVRVSMGYVVTVTTIRAGELRTEMACEGLGMEEEGTKCSDGGLPRVLKWLREEMRIQCFAAVVDADDDGDGTDYLPPLISLEAISESTGNHSSSSWVCVLGNEGHGIRDEVVKEASCRIRIGMANGVDSLSLPVAAGILIHGLSLSNKIT